MPITRLAAVDRPPVHATATAATVRLEWPMRTVDAPTQLGALSGALYRRGAPLPPILHPTPGARIEARTDGRPKAAVIGAGHVGATTTLRLVETSLFATVTMIDIVPGLAEGLALDMWHSAGLRGFDTHVEGSEQLSALAGADYVVMTAGRPRKPGMSRTDLTGVNAEIVRTAAAGIRQHAPRAVVVVVTNPLEEMTELMARETGFAPNRVLGMAGVLDSARFCALVALTGIAGPAEVDALALGSHGPEMVIPLSLATAGGRPLEGLLPAEQLAAIVERARDSGAEVVRLLKTGSAYYAPAESAAAMVRSMVSGDNHLIAACVRSGGAYGLADTRVGLPVRLGREGVAEVVELPLRPNEREALTKAAQSIAARIAELG
jgi:malate dehydrogenase